MMELCDGGESILGRLPVLGVKRVISTGETPGIPSYRDRVVASVAL